MVESVSLRVVQSVDPSVPVGLQVAVPESGGVVGRHPEVEVCLPGSTVSRRHARLERTEAGWMVTPLTQTNAVYVGGQVVEEASPLYRDSLLQLGGVVVVLATEAETSPVLQRLDQPVLLEVRLDGGGCTAHAGGALLPLPPLEARLLGALVERAGQPVHRWDLLEALGGSNLDKAMSKLRAGLREALGSGLLPLDAVAEALGVEPEVRGVLKALIVTRRGHGYLLALPPHRVRLEHV